MGLLRLLEAGGCAGAVGEGECGVEGVFEGDGAHGLVHFDGDCVGKGRTGVAVEWILEGGLLLGVAGDQL